MNETNFEIPDLDETDEEIRDEVMDEFTKLKNAIKVVTDNKASLRFSYMSQDDASTYFKCPGTENYYVDLVYTIDEIDGENTEKRKLRNRFCCISYNGTIPVSIVDLKKPDGESEPQSFSQISELHNFLNVLIQYDSFRKSLIRAKRGTRSIVTDD